MFASLSSSITLYARPKKNVKSRFKKNNKKDENSSIARVASARCNKVSMTSKFLRIVRRCAMLLNGDCSRC